MSLPRPPTLDEVCQITASLPCSPVLLPRLISALQDEDSTASDIEEIILLDSALTASTLRLANSAALSGGRAVISVEEAIVRLGSQEIYRLAALALVSRWESTCGQDQGERAGDFSRHALCTAVAAERMAVMSGAIDPQVAYTAGLVCKMGKLALSYACARYYPSIREYCAEQNVTWAEAERHVLGYDQAEAGTSLLRAWRFPEILSLAIEFQAQPAAAPDHAQPLLAHLHAAQYMAVTLGPGVSEEGFLFTLNSDFLTEHGFSSEMLESLMPDIFQWVDARLGDRLTHGALAF